MNEDLKSLESFLNEVKKHILPAKEKTIFALGGRSYYENPASDLLAFFLKPDAEHGLKDLFLSTFLECIGEIHRQLDMSCVDIGREVPTANQNRIDLQILGQDWCLLIENKIYHWQANPFKDYEAHAEQFRDKTKIFSILSPDGIISSIGSANPDRWKGVSYKRYCQKLREGMATKFFDVPFSKWQLFAREFILHMENELYNPIMTKEQLAFVEKHADQITEVKKLAAQYRLSIREELKQRLELSISGHTFDTSDKGWAYYCLTPQWGNSFVVLISPEDAGQKFKIRAYLKDLSEQQLSNATQVLNLGQPTFERPSYYLFTSAGFDSREEAIGELCKLAQIVNGLIKTFIKEPIKQAEIMPTIPA
jgi:hypothetical protein